MAIPTITSSTSASIIDLVGDTPLVRLRRIERDLPGVELYAKAEWIGHLVCSNPLQSDAFNTS